MFVGKHQQVLNCYDKTMANDVFEWMKTITEIACNDVSKQRFRFEALNVFVHWSMVKKFMSSKHTTKAFCLHLRDIDYMITSSFPYIYKFRGCSLKAFVHSPIVLSIAWNFHLNNRIFDAIRIDGSLINYSFCSTY